VPGYVDVASGVDIASCDRPTGIRYQRVLTMPAVGAAVNTPSPADRASRTVSTSAVQASTVIVSRAITLYPLRLLVPTAAFVVTLVIVLGVGASGEKSFYQAAATIIVVLVLSLATQGFFRLDKLPSPPRWIVRLGRRGAALWLLSEQLTALAVLGYLGLGEGAALYALATASGSRLLLALVAAAIASGFFAIGVLAVVADRSPAEPAASPGQPPRGSEQPLSRVHDDPRQ
jgi:hypothetical protein